jgi:hypothetical protein
METHGEIKTLSQTDYSKFITLKNNKKIEFSNYASVWKVILLLLMSEHVRATEPKPGLLGKLFKKSNLIHKAIDEYYTNAFSPEIEKAINIAEEANVVAKIIHEYVQAEKNAKSTINFSENKYQINLFYLEKNFKEVLESLRLTKNRLLFIDGIDVRPNEVNYSDYLECVKGLALATSHLNDSFFPSIKDSKGRMRVVLLVRPDIFTVLNLQNQNTILQDKSITLDWKTTNSEYKSSELFQVASKLLTHSHINESNKGIWEYYFPYKSELYSSSNKDEKTSFVDFLTFSLHRPRDIIQMLKLIQKKTLETKEHVCTSELFRKSIYSKEYSNYLLGEIKDQLLFYYNEDDYKKFLTFFPKLKGKKDFNYVFYKKAYNEFTCDILNKNQKIPLFAENCDLFLQLLFDLNIVSYEEKSDRGTLYRHCFRERSYANISPEVRINSYYRIFDGLHKTLNVGAPIK